MTNKLGLFAILLSLIVISSCKKDKTVIPNEEELITTVTYTLTPVGGGTDIVLNFQDLDGDGGSDPVITPDTATLAANTTYNGTLVLLNETETPAEDITEEIKEEDEDHQFFFSSTVAGLSVAYADQDADGNPVGIKSTVTTGAMGGGKITVILRHEPNKSGAGVATGDITNAGGETDIEVTFDLDVQ